MTEIRMTFDQGGETKHKSFQIHDIDGILKAVFKHGSLEAYAMSVAAKKGWLGGKVTTNLIAIDIVENEDD